MHAFEQYCFHPQPSILNTLLVVDYIAIHYRCRSQPLRSSALWSLFQPVTPLRVFFVTVSLSERKQNKACMLYMAWTRIKEQVVWEGKKLYSDNNFHEIPKMFFFHVRHSQCSEEPRTAADAEGPQFRQIQPTTFYDGKTSFKESASHSPYAARLPEKDNRKSKQGT